jgi:hypothetical protein
MNDRERDWSTILSVVLLLATSLSCFISGRWHRNPAVYALASKMCLVSMMLSCCVGVGLLARGPVAGRRWRFLWPVILTVVTGLPLALLLAGWLLGL